MNCFGCHLSLWASVLPINDFCIRKKWPCKADTSTGKRNCLERACSRLEYHLKKRLRLYGCAPCRYCSNIENLYCCNGCLPARRFWGLFGLFESKTTCRMAEFRWKFSFVLLLKTLRFYFSIKSDHFGDKLDFSLNNRSHLGRKSFCLQFGTDRVLVLKAFILPTAADLKVFFAS